MTTATLAAGNRTMETAVRPRRSLEELVDRLFEAMGFGEESQTAKPSATRTIHEARQLRQAGNVDSALDTLAGVDMARATPGEARWAFTEWQQMVKRRFAGRDVLLYDQGVGRVAALVPNADDGMMLEAVAVLGMRWRPGKTVSRRSLRGLKPVAESAP